MREILLEESRILGFRNLSTTYSSISPESHQLLEPGIQILLKQNPESTVWNADSKDVLD